MFLGLFFFSFFLMDLLAGTFDYRKPQNFIDWFNGLPAVGGGIPHCLYHVFKDVFVECWGLFCNEEKFLITKFSLSYCLVHQFSIQRNENLEYFFLDSAGKTILGTKYFSLVLWKKGNITPQNFSLPKYVPTSPLVQNNHLGLTLWLIRSQEINSSICISTLHPLLTHPLLYSFH